MGRTTAALSPSAGMRTLIQHSTLLDTEEGESQREGLTLRVDGANTAAAADQQGKPSHATRELES